MRITPVNSPQTQEGRPGTCIYIRNFIPSKDITIGEDNNKLLTFVSINLDEDRKLTLKSLYNPPTSFKGISILNNNLNNNTHQQNSIVIIMDSGLHSKFWNPRGYNHVHSQAKDLIRICSSKDSNFSYPKEHQHLQNCQT
ncbi:hypothetical protein O181_021339 [Austropuccinia psidii MF-1]|uniref:Uncharacterized protein n=1 Tax=Austropuccinia psidii MF-1 TaxID=1389203 RepID=A0A9Q3CCZ0_9BASI|nr:hypothetical protein [Austropuccinia psidii MF-1]